MKRSCNYTSLASIARTEGLLYFYLSKKQMPFLEEQKQKAKLARNWLKCNARVSQSNNFLGEAHHTPKVVVHPSHTYSDLALCAKMAAWPPFLVPAIASIVLAISNLNKNPVGHSAFSHNKVTERRISRPITNGIEVVRNTSF